MSAAVLLPSEEGRKVDISETSLQPRPEPAGSYRESLRLTGTRAVLAFRQFHPRSVYGGVISGWATIRQESEKPGRFGRDERIAVEAGKWWLNISVPVWRVRSRCSRRSSVRYTQHVAIGVAEPSYSYCTARCGQDAEFVMREVSVDIEGHAGFSQGSDC